MPAKKSFPSCEEAKKIVHPLEIKSKSEWVKFTKTEEFKALSLPVDPSKTYKNDDFSWGDFLGTGNVSKKNI